MSGRGLHIALTDPELDQLRALSADEQADHVSNVLEQEKFGSDDACETDKSWAYIQAAFTGADPDGALGIPGVGGEVSKPSIFGRIFGGRGGKERPASGDEAFAVMGQMPLLESDDYFIGLVPKEKVSAVTAALEAISAEALGTRVKEVHRRFDASGDPNDAAEYAMGWYPDLVLFYRRAADAGKHVIFTVDF